MTHRNTKAILLGLLLLLSFVFSRDVLADEGHYFKQISLNEGLTQSTVRCILNDRKGFIWIGTRAGLNRFDRSAIRSYLYNKSDAKSIPGNKINFVLEDKTGNIWVGTDKGLALYNAASDDFTTIKHGRQPVVAYSAVELPGGILFGGAGSLYEYNFNKKRVQPVLATGGGSNADAYTGMNLWKNDQVLLSTRRNGAWLFNPVKKSLSRATFIRDKEIMAMYIDPRQQVWVAAYGQGIKFYSQTGQLLHHYHSRNSALNHDVVLDMLERENKLWVATDGGGINILDLQTHTFSALKHIPGNSTSLPENSILSLYQDRENNLWAGSIRGGLIAIKKAFINTYKDAPLNTVYGLSEKTVLSIYEDPKGSLWVGTDGGGVNRFDSKTKAFKHYPATNGLKIASLTGFGESELLLSAFSKGLYIFNKSTGAIRPFPSHLSSDAKIIRPSGIAINVNQVSANEVYLFADQILKYDVQTQTISPIRYNAAQNAHSSLLKISSDATRTFLFGPYGVFELNHAEQKIRTIFQLKNTGNPITAATRDSNGIFWIGDDNGLMYYDPKQKVLKKIRTNLFSSVSALVTDHEGRLWVGAQNMVFSYLIRENKFIAYGESDGVSPNEFLYKPSLVASNGDIYLGGVRGLLHISKDIPSVNAVAPVIELMTLEMNGLPLANGQQPRGEAIDIPWNHTSLVIKVMARESDVFRKKMFRFKIDGQDQPVVETYDHQFNIGSLPAGDYKVLVSSSLKNGTWSDYAEVLHINISPPWFRSWWFICLVLVATAGTIILFYRTAIAKRERKLQWDMKEHEQRSYEAKIKFLIHISHELRTPLTLIYSPLQRLLKNLNLGPDLHQKLSGIYNQASHMKEIIDMVLDVRKIELGQEKLKPGRFAFNHWVQNLAGHFAGEFEERGITLVYDLDPGIENLVFDEKKCRLVLSNLLVNALKFSRPNTRVTIRTARNGGYVRISVADQGIGLQHVDLNQLFKPFYQGVHEQHGSGIGLSFSKILVEMHGGHIGAESNADQGATFYFEIPDGLSVGKEPELDTFPAAVVEKPATGEFSTNPYSILIVEDEPELRLFLADSLSPYFATVIQAKDGLEASEVMTTRPPDIVLSDVMMPGMDGFQLCQHIKENLEVSHIPVVLLTTQGDADSRNLGYKLGADAYIAKPFDLDFLHTILSNLLKNREAIKLKYQSTSLYVAAKEGTFSSADEQFIMKLNGLINDNLEHQELDVEFLTDKMAMSRATLYSKLKNIAGIGVNDYINKFRLEKSVYLLVHTDKSIMEVAAEAGFANQRYFSTVFKQYHEMTPTQYRGKHGFVTNGPGKPAPNPLSYQKEDQHR